MTHWRKYYDYRFICGEELDGKEVVLTITGIDKEEVYSPTNKGKEKKPALKFKETTKMLILNVTNARMISTVLGSPQIESWIGHRICLYPVAIQAFGTTTEAIRVKKVPANAPKDIPAPEFKEIEFDNKPQMVEEGGRE